MGIATTIVGARFAVAETAGEAKESILTIDGKTANGKTFRFTRNDLVKLGAKRVSTHTPWHDGVVNFDGVLARDLMTFVGATGEKAAIYALDDYRADVPLSDFTQYDAIFAYAMNGKPLTVEEKGPLFLVYPYDSEAGTGDRNLLFALELADRPHRHPVNREPKARQRRLAQVAACGLRAAGRRDLFRDRRDRDPAFQYADRRFDQSRRALRDDVQRVQWQDRPRAAEGRVRALEGRSQRRAAARALDGVRGRRRLDADLRRGAFGELIRSDAKMAAEATSVIATVGMLQPLLAAPDAPGSVERIDALQTMLDEPVSGLVSGSLAHSIERTRADAAFLRQKQGEQLALEIGLLVSASGLIGVLLWQKREVQRMHRQQIAASQRFEFLAAHNSLTGLRNRAAFSERIERAFARRASEGGEVALLTLDVDRFKTINDALGHAAGDQLLTSIADRLKRLCGESDDVTAARLGGDEFALLVEGAEAADRAARLAQATLEAMQRPHSIGALSIAANASIGLAHAPSHGDTPNEIVHGSDIALNRAKSRGRGVISVFDTAKSRPRRLARACIRSPARPRVQ